MAMEDFILYKTFPSGGKVSLMSGLDKTCSDYNDLLSIASCFARLGKDVKILAPVHFRDPMYLRVFGALIGGPYERKCPDLLIDGLFFEYESYNRPFKSRKICHMVRRGSEQSERIIIDNNKGVSDRLLTDRVQRMIKDRSFRRKILELYAYEKGIVRRVL